MVSSLQKCFLDFLSVSQFSFKKLRSMWLKDIFMMSMPQIEAKLFQSEWKQEKQHTLCAEFADDETISQGCFCAASYVHFPPFPLLGINKVQYSFQSTNRGADSYTLASWLTWDVTIYNVICPWRSLHQYDVTLKGTPVSKVMLWIFSWRWRLPCTQSGCQLLLVEVLQQHLLTILLTWFSFQYSRSLLIE